MGTRGTAHALGLLALKVSQVCFASLTLFRVREIPSFPLLMGKVTSINHVVFVATINCSLNFYSINKVGCQRVNYPVDKWWVINVALTLNAEDDVRSSRALKKFTRTHFSWR